MLLHLMDEGYVNRSLILARGGKEQEFIGAKFDLAAINGAEQTGSPCQVESHCGDGLV